MTPINLVLPTPPPLNRLYVNMVLPAKWPNTKPRAMKWLSNEGKAYKATVAEIAGGNTPFIGLVWVTLNWFRPRRVGDVDAPIKIVLDSLAGHAYLNDKQVKRLHVEWFDDKIAPRVEVTIEVLGLC